MNHARGRVFPRAVRSHLRALETPNTPYVRTDQLPSLIARSIAKSGQLHGVLVSVLPGEVAAHRLPSGQRSRLLRGSLGHHELARAAAHRTTHKKHRRNPDSLGHGSGLAGLVGGQKGLPYPASLGFAVVASPSSCWAAARRPTHGFPS